jgi:hypothetical protein
LLDASAALLARLGIQLGDANERTQHGVSEGVPHRLGSRGEHVADGADGGEHLQPPHHDSADREHADRYAERDAQPLQADTASNEREAHQCVRSNAARIAAITALDLAMIARAGCALLLAAVVTLSVLAVERLAAEDWATAALWALYALALAAVRRWVGVLGRLAEDE